MSDTLLAAIVGGAALIVSTWLQRRPTKTQKDIKGLAETAVAQTEKTGNGFARTVQDKLDALTKSSGALHKRLDQLSEVVVNFDGRITHLEDHDDSPTPHLPQGDRRRPGDDSSSSWDQL